MPLEASNENNKITHFVALPLRYPEIVVRMRESYNKDLNSVADWGLSLLSSFGTVETLNLEDQFFINSTTIIREYLLETSNLFGKCKIHCLDSYFIQENREYIFQSCSLPMQWKIMHPYFLQMLENIKFN